MKKDYWLKNYIEEVKESKIGFLATKEEIIQEALNNYEIDEVTSKNKLKKIIELSNEKQQELIRKTGRKFSLFYDSKVNCGYAGLSVRYKHFTEGHSIISLTSWGSYKKKDKNINKKIDKCFKEYSEITGQEYLDGNLYLESVTYKNFIRNLGLIRRISILIPHTNFIVYIPIVKSTAFYLEDGRWVSHPRNQKINFKINKSFLGIEDEFNYSEIIKFIDELIKYYLEEENDISIGLKDFFKIPFHCGCCEVKSKNGILSRSKNKLHTPTYTAPFWYEYEDTSEEDEGQEQLLKEVLDLVQPSQFPELLFRSEGLPSS